MLLPESLAKLADVIAVVQFRTSERHGNMNFGDASVWKWIKGTSKNKIRIYSDLSRSPDEREFRVGRYLVFLKKEGDRYFTLPHESAFPITGGPVHYAGLIKTWRDEEDAVSSLKDIVRKQERKVEPPGRPNR